MQLVALHDLDGPVAALGRGASDARSLITSVGEDAQNEREQGPRVSIQHEGCTVAILDIGGMYGGAQQQAEGIYQKMAFLALDLLSRVVAMPITAPPFSALFTLWLSMIAALGLASRSSRSLHST